MVTVTSSTTGSTIEIPELWERHNWEHPFVFLRNVQQARAGADPTVPLRPGLNKINSGWDYQRQFRRRSLTSRSSAGISHLVMRELLRVLHECLAEFPHLFAAFATADVEGYKDGVYICHADPRSYRSQSVGSVDLSPGIQGQGWARGPGLSVIVGVDAETLNAGRDAAGCEAAYGEALVDVGRCGQYLTMEANAWGLATRMTPAVKESFFADVLNLHPDQDALYYLKVASPAAQPGDI